MPTWDDVGRGFFNTYKIPIVRGMILRESVWMAVVGIAIGISAEPLG